MFQRALRGPWRSRVPAPTRSEVLVSRRRGRSPGGLVCPPWGTIDGVGKGERLSRGEALYACRWFNSKVNGQKGEARHCPGGLGCPPWGTIDGCCKGGCPSRATLRSMVGLVCRVNTVKRKPLRRARVLTVLNTAPVLGLRVVCILDRRFGASLIAGLFHPRSPELSSSIAGSLWITSSTILDRRFCREKFNTYLTLIVFGISGFF